MRIKADASKVCPQVVHDKMLGTILICLVVMCTCTQALFGVIKKQTQAHSQLLGDGM